MMRKIAGLVAVASLLGVTASAASGCNVIVSAGDYKVVGDAGPTGCSAEGIADKIEPMVKACALFLGCSPFLPDISLSFCATFGIPKTSNYYSCALTANTCSDVFDCRGIGDAKEGDCASGSTGYKCVGSRAVTCNPSVRNGGYYSDCDVRGGTCSKYTASGKDAVGCNVTSCTGDTTDWKCSAQNLYQCYGGIGIGINCSKFSAKCETRGTDTSCFFNKPTCGDDSTTCDAGNIAVCSSGALSTYGCAALGESCLTTEKGGGYCLSPNCTTTDFDGCQEACDPDGVTAILCIGGAKHRVDCTKYGFSQCHRYDPSSSIKEPYVICQL